MSGKQVVSNDFQRKPYLNTKQRSYVRDLHTEYQQYQKQYSRTGYLKTQALTARKTFPVQGVKVEVLKNLPSGTYTISTQQTDASGNTSPVKLPTLPSAESLDPGVAQPFVTYEVRFTHPNYTEVVVKDVPIYEDLTTFQQVEMIPTDVSPNGTQMIEYNTKAPVV